MPINVGSIVIICGIYVISSKHNTPAMMNGHTFATSAFIEIFAILHATNKFDPTGGVTWPIAKLEVAITPNAIMEYYISLMIGSSIGSNK